MSTVTAGAADVMDAALHRLREVHAQVRTMIATADRIVDDTAWHARAVADYRRIASGWEADLRDAAADLGAYEHDLSAICAVTRAAGPAAGGVWGHG